MTHRPASRARSMYERDLDKNAANHVALTPLGFLERAATVYPEQVAVIDGDTRITWAQIYRRCCRLASALARRAVKNHTVAVLAPNSQAAYECHFGVPMAGAVLCAINTRLDAAAIAFILTHSEARVLLVDGELADLARAALAKMADMAKKSAADGTPSTPLPSVIDIETAGFETRLGAITYADFLASGDPQHAWDWPADEWDAISLNYTSGTTGNPKGVVYHHRGAYLNAMSNIVGWHLPRRPVYLWTLPMFHCNGWCFPWSLAAVGGVNVCLRQIDATRIYHAIAAHDITHFCGAPVIMNMLINATEGERGGWSPAAGAAPVNMMTAAAPPPAAVLAAMEAQGFCVTHVYGLTETYGPAVICAWNTRWDELPAEQKAEKNARQGVRYHALEGLEVMHPQRMTAVARDGVTMGETMFRGNIVMKGYLKNPAATVAAFADGWFHSGDLGVLHADGYLQLKDRAKDIIISGGENISSIEIEDCLYAHPQIADAAVVARPHPRWGETPCAFVCVAAGATLSERDVMAHCRDNLAHFKAPTAVVFGELPKTSTGKVQKYKLRALAAKL